MYISRQIANCNIKNEGIKWFSKANWSELKTLHLGKQTIIIDLNEFNTEGYYHLVKTHFPKLQILILSTIGVNQMGNIAIMSLIGS